MSDVSAFGIAPSTDSSRRRDALGVYVHWPFCKAKCPYCDFNSHVRNGIEQTRWRAALLAELEHAAREAPGRRVETMFFGGGTPSLMEPATVAALIARTRQLWDTAPDLEITLEANPTSVEAGRFAELADAGVNRVSLGLQALDAAALRFLGREHSVDEALAALQTARQHFARYSFDLIYARPGQTLAGWEAELRRALSFGTEHLSLYQLTIEPGTRFATLFEKGELKAFDPDEAADLFEATRAIAAAAGLPAYEVSNHARPGAESRHNLTYWRYGDYAGVGPGAHGRRNGVATLRRKKPENWLAAIERNGHGIEREDPLEAHDRGVEALLMGLRLAEGVDLARIPDAPLDGRALAGMVAQGLVQREGSRLRVTDAGMPVLEAILRELVIA